MKEAVSSALPSVLSAAWPKTMQHWTRSGAWRETRSRFADIDAVIYARDEELLRLARGQELQPGFDAQTPAGEDDDRVGLAVGIGDARRHEMDEPQEAAEPRGGEENDETGGELHAPPAPAPHGMRASAPRTVSRAVSMASSAAASGKTMSTA